jgi:hypothetical protein
MSDTPLMPKVELHEFLEILKSEEDRQEEEQDYRPPYARFSEPEVSSQRENATKQQQNEYGAMGELMKAIFKDGVHLTGEEDFVTFYLFARVVEQVCRFGRQGMKDPAAIHDVSAYSAMLENRIILYR